MIRSAAKKQARSCSQPNRPENPWNQSSLRTSIRQSISVQHLLDASPEPCPMTGLDHFHCLNVHPHHPAQNHQVRVRHQGEQLTPTVRVCGNTVKLCPSKTPCECSYSKHYHMSNTTRHIPKFAFVRENKHMHKYLTPLFKNN